MLNITKGAVGVKQPVLSFATATSGESITVVAQSQTATSAKIGLTLCNTQVL
jgi:hypothetical protein